jgi:NitT/TauT family transport system permease protein
MTARKTDREVMPPATSGRKRFAFTAGSGRSKPAIAGIDEDIARERARQRRRERRRERLIVTIIQLLIVAVVLCGWQWVPQIPAVAAWSHLSNPFFISSPSRIATEMYDLATGSDHAPLMWHDLLNTVSETLVGTVIGMVLGAAAGLALSSSPRLSMIFQPFIIAINAVPRIALIPILVLISGIGFRTSVIISVLVVFFVVFFNAFEAGRNIAPELLQNAAVNRASRFQITWHVRRPFVVAWSLASLPLAVTFSLLTVVTTEILTGQAGMGYLISEAISFADATLTFAVVAVLSIVGMVIVGLTSIVRHRVLRWWDVAS